MLLDKKEGALSPFSFTLQHTIYKTIYLTYIPNQLSQHHALLVYMV